VAACSSGKCPRVLIAFLTWRCRALMVLVSGMKGLRCQRVPLTGPLQLLSASGPVSTVRPSGTWGIRE